MAAIPASTNMLLLARNPILTSAKSVWGYEIQTSAEHVESAPATGRGSAGVAVIAGDYVGLRSILARNKKMLLAYSREQIADMIPRALPPQASAVLVGVADQCTGELLPALERLVAEKHTIALEWEHSVTPESALLPLATVCVVDSAQITPETVSVFARLQKLIIVRNVATREGFDTLRSLGFTLFQGRYFKSAEIITGKKISTHHNSRLRILSLIEGEAPDLVQLAQTIHADVSLGYRLLTYLNSPAFGFVRKIDSIRQAMVLFGWNNLRNWLRAVVLADMTQGEQETELLYVSLVRGKFLELIVTRFDYWNFSPDEMFLLGTFSLLDTILGLPMAEVLSYLPLTESQKNALTGNSACEYSPLLQLMHAVEEGPAANLDAVLRNLSLDHDTTLELARDARVWVASMLEGSSPDAA